MIWRAKAFEEKMTPIIDGIYKSIFSGLVTITRSARNNNDSERLLFMDRELAIDTHLCFHDGTVLTLQEKSLSNTFYKFRTFTFEYYNDPIKKEEGEWFKLASQLYFCGYVNKEETNYVEYWIINVPKFRLFLKKEIGIDVLTEKYLRHNKPPAKANFFAIPFSLFENNKEICIWKK